MGLEVRLEEESITATLLGLLLGESLEGGVDGGNGKEDTSTRTDGTHEVSSDGESSNAKTSEGSGGGNVALEDLEGRLITVTLDDHVLLSELTSNILGGGTRDIDPGLGEEGARGKDEDDIDEGVQRISSNLAERGRRRNVVGNTTNRDGLSLVVRMLLPGSQNTDDGVGEVLVQQLREEEEVRNESRLQDDGNVGGVEQLDGVSSVGTTSTLVGDGDIDAESLEIDDSAEDQNGSQKVGDIGQIRSVESLLQSTSLILTSHQQVEQRNQSSLILSSGSSSHSVG